MFYSVEFLIFYLPLIFLGFLIIKKIFPSLIPYYFLGLLYVSLYLIDLVSFVLVFITSTINYLIVRKIHKTKNSKILIFIGIVFSLLPLIIFKFGHGFFDRESLETSVLFTYGIPIGLSFYSLQQITAIIDSRNASLSILSYSRHLLYLGFFPNFIAGPIFTYRNAVEQISSLGFKKIPNYWIATGILLFLTGLLKKLWIANPLGGIINQMVFNIKNLDSSITIFDGWFIIWGFLVQLYFDFSAYSDIAIGLALCFGILLPVNFDSPLKSYSTQEYISRWHISFTSFVREYFFIPTLSLLKKLPIKDMEKKMILSWAIGLFLSYIIIGIWHAPNLIIMGTTTLVIIILFLLKLPTFLFTDNISKDKNSKNYLNRIVILMFSMLMAISLKVQDIDSLFKIYLSIIDFKSISLPLSLQEILPNFIKEEFSFNGFLPLLNGYKYGNYIFSNTSSYIFILIVATFIIFLSPNTMDIFGIKNFKKRKKVFFMKGFLFYLLCTLFLFNILFLLLLESSYAQTFIYERY